MISKLQLSKTYDTPKIDFKKRRRKAILVYRITNVTRIQMVQFVKMHETNRNRPTTASEDKTSVTNYCSKCKECGVRQETKNHLTNHIIGKYNNEGNILNYDGCKFPCQKKMALLFTSQGNITE